MFLAPLFRSFQPLENPLGFGAADCLELVLALALMVFAIALRSRLEPNRRRFAGKDRVVHAAAGSPANCAPPRPATPSPGSDARYL